MANKLLILVEDDPNDQILLNDALSQLQVPHQRKLFNHGIEMLDYLHGKSEPITLPVAIFLDLKLPFISGKSIVKKLREHPLTRTIPVVILSSSNEESDKMSCYAEGVNSYVCKPIDYEEFLEKVKQLGQYWLSINLPAIP